MHVTAREPTSLTWLVLLRRLTAVRREGRPALVGLLRLVVLVVIVRIDRLLNVWEASVIELIFVVSLSLLLQRVLVVRGDDALLLHAAHVSAAHLLLTLTVAVNIVGELGVYLAVLDVKHLAQMPVKLAEPVLVLLVEEDPLHILVLVEFLIELVEQVRLDVATFSSGSPSTPV